MTSGVLDEMPLSALHLAVIFGSLTVLPLTPILLSNKGHRAIRGKASGQDQSEKHHRQQAKLLFRSLLIWKCCESDSSQAQKKKGHICQEPLQTLIRM